MNDPNVGKMVNVKLPMVEKRIERILHEDCDGIFIKYKNKLIRVKPKLNDFGENNTKSYVIL